MSKTNKSQSLLFNNPSPEELLDKEWIITNGIGGYASSTVCGLNTRKYHGLLVASLHAPTDRRVLLSAIEESVSYDSKTIEFSSNQYPDLIHPKGYKYLTAFSKKPFPKFTYQFESLILEKELCMVHNSNSTIISYTNKSAFPVQLNLNPLMIERDFHGVSRKSDSYNFYFKEDNHCLKVYAKSDSKPLFIKYSKGTFHKQRTWYYNFQYLEEKDRGMEYTEDLYSIGTIKIPLEPGETAYLIISLEEKHLNESPEIFFSKERERLQSLIPAYVKDEWTKDLIISGNQFIVKRESTNSYSVIAGYHWFSDWGRDTMIAIRGLCISLKRQEESRSILQTFLNYLSEGMLPNRFPDYGQEPEYNTVDATLWLFVALHDYYKAFDDLEFIKTTLPLLNEIIEWHKKGTRYNIRLTEEGLITAGDYNSQLTWMDAKCNGIAITPRQGCAVEINALWFNALNITRFFQQELNDKKNVDLDELINKCGQSFRKYFLNKEGYLNDVVVPGTSTDNSIRPNQIIALSLPFRLLNPEEEKNILNKVQHELFTPYGLRTLSKSDSNFKETYRGDVFTRDSAYHQGTIWPFLLGEFYSAYLRINNHSSESRKFIISSLIKLENHFYFDSCLHGISEIFDGGNPTSGRGAIQQAWSISSVLKTIIDNNLYEKSVKKETKQDNI
ncbi:MAG TPA: amylo-alpha-1,6-glucosidase [Cytophagales bacterium]|nr:amylo-alpha-1,6-glucosidase [Cytophagales bacterium]